MTRFISTILGLILSPVALLAMDAHPIYVRLAIYIAAGVTGLLLGFATVSMKTKW